MTVLELNIESADGRYKHLLGVLLVIFIIISTYWHLPLCSCNKWLYQTVGEWCTGDRCMFWYSVFPPDYRRDNKTV